MSKNKRSNKSKSRREPANEADVVTAAPQIEKTAKKRRMWLAIGAVTLLLTGAVLVWRTNGFGLLRAGRTVRPVGAVTGCQKVPPFVQTLGFTNQAALSTSEKSRPGLFLVERNQAGNTRRYQHPSWKAAGFLAPITRDGDGNVFVAPAPVINTLLNPVEAQNKVFKVDGRSQELTAFAELPVKTKQNEQNPFGALGLAFDCETASLYVSSVHGSTRDQEAGGIYRIDARTGKVTAQLEKTDAIGLSAFDSATGRRLYYGLARAPEVRSIALDDNGNFVGESRAEVSLANLGSRGDDKARRINFTPSREMLVSGIEFDFNLIAPTEKQETLYRFGYDTTGDKWNLLPPAAN